ncbi:MAG TPA: response regulator [Chloroflexia bacterium]|nr:response regulator [Chloroflexia bacterium]
MAVEILIVEDNPLNMELARDLLEAKGYSVREAATAQEGIDAVKERVPDLVLMDIQLPGMDGLTATRILRQDARLSELIIVALTAHAMKGDEDKVLEAGCNGYISKPIDTRQFTRQIAEFLQKATASN